ncbi:homocysteine S-methyltransferase family protein [Desulfovibrio sp. TomC]|uniref:homocysteine S-methyltransferase family protein n=1 Tax=Desulfovibrio sp. TomC TaxID=1562888 RepID=UPI000574950D|nr:homocysteine S-methyltransferase family protein [Desulfovibrio sp. TomC]KHK04095.1 5-methyltetrahydrofolate--homocysteine methyltransferase [Desulfovibrio sp. TomC]
MGDFRKALGDDGLLIFDGAMGTLLQGRGLSPGQSPELFGLAHPEAIMATHREYVQAGSRVITSNTFGGSRYKLPAGTDVVALNREMARAARQAAGPGVFVAGSVGPTGHFVAPLGKASLRDLVDAFAEQIRGLAEGGCDLIIGETHFDLAEAKAVILACRQVCSLPVAMCMTFEGAASLTGSSPEVFADAMENLGVDLIGVNCGQGPDDMRLVGEAFSRRLTTPFFVKPNAGMPRLENGCTVFPMGPEEFAQKTARFADLGAKALSGCCGTTPAHIAALAGSLAGRSWKRADTPDRPVLAITSRSLTVPVGGGSPLALIGERINPTGKPELAAELVAGEYAKALAFAEEQTTAGAHVLDVNVGAPMVDEVAVLPGLALELVKRQQLPLCLDSNNADALTAGLWAYPGTPLVNSISGEPGRMERLGPVCRDHGAPFILLPLKGRKLPVTAAERLAIIEELLAQADSLGIPRRLILVDALALTVSSKPEAAVACLETIRYCREKWGLPTVLGLSNISFGLPARELVNSAFFAMCLGAGMAAAIANPNVPRLMETLTAGEVLLGRDPQAGRFIGRYAGWKPNQGGGGATAAAAGASDDGESPLRRAVVHGRREEVLALVETALAEGRDPAKLLSDELIPGIMSVGERYERKEFFLPQLLAAAEAMRAGFSRLEPLLVETAGAAKARIVMATVEGDIHDIGKNIVCLMLKNHGFEVIDLGKDVSAERIVDAASQHGAAVIGLSALMTTTMVRMEDTVRLVRERGLAARIMVGGAVVTEAFAKSIGADAYAADAVDAVRQAKLLAGGV